MASHEGWRVECSKGALGTVNPIRDIVDKLDFKSLPKDKKLIQLSIGDPSKYGNLPIPPTAQKAIIEVVQNGDSNGYQPSFGMLSAREAIAERYSTATMTYKAQDVYIGSGCSDALNMSVCSLLDEGDNMLIPAPGFSLYTTLCGRYKFKPKFYRLDPDRQWEIDLKDLECKINKRTKAILVNNPSNPCGSCYSRKHVKEICDLAYKYRLPILADEIYANMIFEGETFTSCAEVSNGPVYVLGGLAKQYLAPGWRVGWIVLHDPENRLEKVRPGLCSLSQVILGANSICQAAIPSILKNTPKAFYSGLNKTLSHAASIVYEACEKISCLNPVKPQGAMYLMVEILTQRLKDIDDDVQFSQKLLKEEAVVVLPGTIFNSPNYFRVVLCPPPNQLRAALGRIENFCERHSQNEQTKRKNSTEILISANQVRAA